MNELKEKIHKNGIDYILVGDYNISDLNEQAQERLDTIMEQIKEAEGVTEKLKAESQLEWLTLIQKFGFL